MTFGMWPPHNYAAAIHQLAWPFDILKFFYFFRRKNYNDPPDTVILCTMPRGPAAPSISPFPIKLETYLRVANIPHKVIANVMSISVCYWCTDTKYW